MRTFELLLVASAGFAAFMMKKNQGFLLSVLGGVGTALLLDELLSPKGEVTFEAPEGANVSPLGG